MPYNASVHYPSPSLWRYESPRSINPTDVSDFRDCYQPPQLSKHPAHRHESKSKTQTKHSELDSSRPEISVKDSSEQVHWPITEKEPTSTINSIPPYSYCLQPSYSASFVATANVQRIEKSTIQSPVYLAVIDQDDFEGLHLHTENMSFDSSPIRYQTAGNKTNFSPSKDQFDLPNIPIGLVNKLR